MKLGSFKIFKKDADHPFLALKVFMLSCAWVSVGCGAFIMFARYCFYEESLRMVSETADYLYEQSSENLKDPVLDYGQSLVDTKIFSQNLHTKKNYVDPKDLALTEKTSLIKVKGLKRKLGDHVYELRFDPKL